MKNEKTLEETNYLIIGAGPAGLILGINLLKLGLKSQIIERHDQRYRPVCGEYLSPQGVTLLKKLGLEETLIDFEKIKGMNIYSAYETLISTHFPGNAAGVSLNRTIFHDRLAFLYKKLGGQIHYKTTLEEILSTPEGYLAKTNHSIVSCAHLVGADGRNSMVGKLLGFETQAPQEKRLALHCFLRPKKELPRFGQMHILPDGSYIGINPISKDEVNFSIVTNNEMIKKAGGKKELMNFWINQRETLKKQFYPLTNEEIKSTAQIRRDSLEIQKNRAVLIGDASGFIDPLTGEGITTAIKTAYILTEEIAKEEKSTDAFINYELRRRNDFKDKEELNFKFQKIIHSPILCEIIGQTLNLSKKLRDTFIGVIGNVYTPKEAIKTIIKFYLLGRN